MTPDLSKTVRLGEVAHVEMGQAPPSVFVSNERDGGLPFLQGNAEFTETHPEPRLQCKKPQKTCQANDVLISVRAPVGAINLADRSYCIGRGVAAIRFGRPDARFGLHALRYFSTSLRRVAQGTTFEAISRSDLTDLRLLFPDAPQRKAIGVILDTLDEAILATGQLISKLDLLKRGLLYDLLTRGIDENGELRDGEKLQHSPIGAIPKAWQAMAVGEVASHVTSGSRDWAGYYAEDGPLFLRIGNLTREHVNLRLEDVVHVQPPASGEGKRTRLIEGDVLLSITADLGIVGVVPAALGEAYVNQHIAVVRIKRHLANPRWIGLYLSGEAAQAQVRRFDDPGAKAGLNLPTVRSLVLPLPPMREQEKIVARIDAADIAVAAERDYLTKLQLLRVGLREALVTGRVPVTALVGDTAA